jgi:chromosome partitioning protein
MIPADPALADLHGKLESRHKIYKLKELLESLAGFDTVFIDTPPALGFFTSSALIAAHRCLIPFDCDDFSRRALYQLLGTVREIREDHNPELDIAGVVVNFFQARARLPQQLVDELVAEGLPVLEPFLMSSVKVRESHQQNRALIHLAPRHKLSEQIRELYRSVAAAASSPG